MVIAGLPKYRPFDLWDARQHCEVFSFFKVLALRDGEWMVVQRFKLEIGVPEATSCALCIVLDCGTSVRTETLVVLCTTQIQ